MMYIKVLYLGIFLTLALYHTLVWLGRKNDLSNLSYVIYCIGIIILVYNTQIYTEQPSFNRYYCNLGMFLTGILNPLSCIFFLATMFDLSAVKKTLLIVTAIFTALFVIFTTFYAVTKNDIHLTLFIIVILIVTIIYTFLFYREVIRLRQNQRKHRLVLAGFTPVIIIFIALIIVTIPLEIGNDFLLFYTLFLYMAVIFAYALTDGFNCEHTALIILKNTLEQKVKSRTLALEQANHRIKESSEQKLNMFINVAHETKTPLTIIRNYLDRDIANRGFTQEIKIARQNLTKLIRDMINFLDLEKLTRHQSFYRHTTPVDISAFTRLKVDHFQDIAAHKQITLTSTITPSIHTIIDITALERIINNLLENAVKYTPTSGKITVILHQTTDRAILSVIDTGIGIPQDRITTIFNPFHQISGPKGNTQGIGLGLNIVKKITDQINAPISINSNPNQGTTITIEFQKHTPTPGENIEPIEITGDPDFEIIDIRLDEETYHEDKKTIFLVEDNTQLINLLQKELTPTYNLYYAIDARTALEKIKTIPHPDLIISDIMMDHMNGYVFKEKLDTLGEKYRAVPFIYLTAKTGKQDILTGLNKGAVDFITKPFTTEELKARIKSILIQQATHEQVIHQEHDNYKDTKFDDYLTTYDITDKEKILIHHVIDGKVNKEIAYELGIALDTVKKYLSRIYTKLNIKSRIELTKLYNKTDNTPDK